MYFYRDRVRGKSSPAFVDRVALLSATLNSNDDMKAAALQGSILGFGLVP
jgi:hypothetical protein